MKEYKVTVQNYFREKNYYIQATNPIEAEEKAHYLEVKYCRTVEELSSIKILKVSEMVAKK